MKNNKSITDKLTALWALNESGLGGFLHVFNSPFTGLIVGGIAILLISLIAWYSEKKWNAILKALLIVLIIKAAVSPYSPPAAYIAVSFQAVFGALLFANFPWKGLTLMVLGMVTFLQSALQKLLVLTIIYGTHLWEAIDLYGAWVVEKLGYTTTTSTASFLIALYLSVYGIGGLLAGLFIRSIIKLISTQESDTGITINIAEALPRQKKSKKSFRLRMVLIWGITITVILLAFTLSGGVQAGWQKAVYVMLRSFLVLLLWYLVLGPLLLRIIRNYLTRKKSQYREDVTNAIDLFPYFRSIISYTWKETKHLKGYTRFKYFTAKTIMYCIHFEVDPR